jgi:hypothetical protein
MKKAGKASTCYSDNPKMGQPYVRGYKDGGKVEKNPMRKLPPEYANTLERQFNDLPTEESTIPKSRMNKLPRDYADTLEREFKRLPKDAN